MGFYAIFCFLLYTLLYLRKQTNQKPNKCYFFKGVHFLNLKFGFPNNFLVQLGQGFHFWWVRYGYSNEYLISTEGPEPKNRPEDRLCEELQYPWAVAQTAEETVL